MQLPLAHLDAAVIEEVSVHLWGQLFDVVGWPFSLIGKRESYDHGDVLEAFAHDDPTDELLQAIEALHSLGTETGHEAIVAAMNDRRVPLDELPPASGEREFALQLFLKQRNSASLAEVFARAQAQVEEGADHRRYNEFLGKETRIIANLKAKAEVLRHELLEYCREHDLGEHVDVRAFEDDGAYVFNVIRTHHTKKPLAVIPGRSARATIEFRPVHGDIVRYEAPVGRLRIAARVASMVEFYRRTLGLILFEDEQFFAGEPVCSLRVLQERGRAALDDHRVSGVGRVWMTECLWERGDRELHHIRSTDCFRQIEELDLPLIEGVLIQAKLKLEVVGASTRPATVTIRAPSRIETTQKVHERLVDEFLTSVGIRSGKRGAAEIDLWSLYPWRHAMPVWRTLFGNQTDSLVQKGVLNPILLTSVPISEHPGAGQVLDAHGMSAGEYYGVSRAPEIQSRSLSATDLDAMQLDPEQLRLYLRTTLGASGGAVACGDLLDVGAIEMGDQRIHVYYALRPPPAGTGDHIRIRAASAQHVLLIPSSRFGGTELAHVVIDEPIPSIKRLAPQIVAACGLEGVVPAVFGAPERARLVVDTQLKKIWFDGTEITGIRAGTHPYLLVEALARRCPSPMSTKDLTRLLSGARKDGDTAARQAKREAKAIIERAMAGADRKLDDDPFPSGPTGFYRCAFLSHVV
jgi:hypothetical protein